MSKEAKKEALKDLIREMRKLMVAGKGDDPSPEAVSEMAEAKEEAPRSLPPEEEDEESAVDDAPKKAGAIVTLKGLVPRGLKKGAVPQPAPAFVKGGKGKGK